MRYFFSLSLLSHWDAIFILPYIVFVFYHQYKKGKLTGILKFIVVSLLFTLPYVIPFAYNLAKNANSLDYFKSRIDYGTNFSERFSDYYFRIELYNPFILVYLYLLCIPISFIFIKKSRGIILWFLLVSGFFLIIIKRPGTHIYNFFYSGSIILGYTFGYLISNFKKYLRFVFVTLTILIISFLYYQSYKLFVEVSVEYPRKPEDI